MEIQLDDWQKKVMAAEGDILLCTGRRVGKTEIMARKAVERMVKEKIPVVIVSLTEDQAMIIHFMALHYIEDKYPKMLEGRQTIKRITLTNGSVMISRPVGDTGDATRGYEGGILIVDEASRMPKLFWIAAKPILLTKGGEIWMCSTPFGKRGYFWEKFNESWNLRKEGARFKAFYISTPEVIDNRPVCESWTQQQRDGALRILKEEKKEMSDLEYGQEYLGLFMDDIMQLYPDDLIRSRMIVEESKVRTGDNYMGSDVGRMGEGESSFEIGRRIGDRLIHVYHEVTTKSKLTETANKIKVFTEQWNLIKTWLDAIGMGAGVLDILLADNKTKRRVEAVLNVKKVESYKDESQRRKTTKEDGHLNLKVLMEEGRIDLINKPEIFTSLKSIQYEYLKDGRIRIFGNYAHIADGLWMMAMCMKQKHLKFAIHYV